MANSKVALTTSADLIGQRVRVHLNLHLGLFSIADPASGKVYCNATDVTLSEVTYKASKAGHARIHRLGKRKVVAYAVGTLIATDTAPDITDLVEVTYNPWRRADFHTREGQPVTEAARAVFVDRHSYVEVSP